MNNDKVPTQALVVGVILPAALVALVLPTDGEQTLRWVALVVVQLVCLSLLIARMPKRRK